VLVVLDAVSDWRSGLVGLGVVGRRVGGACVASLLQVPELVGHVARVGNDGACHVVDVVVDAVCKVCIGVVRVGKGVS